MLEPFIPGREESDEDEYEIEIFSADGNYCFEEVSWRGTLLIFSLSCFALPYTREKNMELKSWLLLQQLFYWFVYMWTGWNALKLLPQKIKEK